MELSPLLISLSIIKKPYFDFKKPYLDIHKKGRRLEGPIKEFRCFKATLFLDIVEHRKLYNQKDVAKICLYIS